MNYQITLQRNAKYARVQGWLTDFWETKFIDISYKTMSIDNLRLQIL